MVLHNPFYEKLPSFNSSTGKGIDLFSSLSLFSEISSVLGSKKKVKKESGTELLKNPCSNNKIDYTMCHSLMSALWKQSPKKETEKLYRKHNLERCSEEQEEDGLELVLSHMP